MRPVQEVASGGELSRIMLALKSVSAQADGVDTLIFDEIDTESVEKQQIVLLRKWQ